MSNTFEDTGAERYVKNREFFLKKNLQTWESHKESNKVSSYCI